ncbi:MAG: acyl-CoA dehydrogenase [Gammaproteobacteria bacterium]|nr:acyl-CoA dehydrogenase [Gammaproteobacteria bacterium]MBQ0840417.1 acyl-CoA dehydrogenase [Gammaproteobacteria bacterium]
MTDYTAPLDEMNFLVNDVLGMAAIATLPGYEECSAELVEAIYSEAGRYFSEVIAPTNQSADSEGCRVENAAVVSAESLDGLYQGFVEGGWPALTGDPQFDGQGMPHLAGVAVEEMCQSANLSFSLLPLLTKGVITAIERFASDEQKAAYLPQLISGEWTGTMNLTESQAGSDLAAVRAKALPVDDHYLISGQKIFITWGDHSYTDNIVHLVLARTPDAPEGVKGISLFIVPKFILDADGKPAQRNDVYPVSVEHKMGIHASPTCVLSFGDKGGAVGYLIGNENEGLSYMFAMMNHARLAVGLQGVSVAERAYQQAVSYARDRVQGNAPDQVERVAIIHHADVRRMLMMMRSQTEAARVLSYSAFAHWDFFSHSPSADTRAYHQRRVDFLTPLVKALSTEVGNEVAYIGVQVHGGMGFIEETGAAQYMRDARILPIYEGTNGIQALDLIGRKLLRDKGAAAAELLAELKQDLQCASELGLEALAQPVFNSFELSEQAIQFVLEQAASDAHFAGAVANDLLLLLSATVAAAMMVKSAIVAQQNLNAGSDKVQFNKSKLATVAFYIEHVLPRTEAYSRSLKNGHSSTMALDIDAF